MHVTSHANTLYYIVVLLIVCLLASFNKYSVSLTTYDSQVPLPLETSPNHLQTSSFVQTIIISFFGTACTLTINDTPC